MKLTYDPEVDAAYLRFGEPIAPGGSVRQVCLPEELGLPGELIFDLDADGKILGLEILFASDALPAPTIAAAEAP